jgi:hypothetical protein
MLANRPSSEFGKISMEESKPCRFVRLPGRIHEPADLEPEAVAAAEQRLRCARSQPSFRTGAQTHKEASRMHRCSLGRHPSRAAES